MESVRKINLLDATHEQVYHDEYGWVSRRLTVRVGGKITQNGRNTDGTWELHQIYIKNNQGDYKRLGDIQLTNRQLLDFDFGEVFIKPVHYGTYYKIEEQKVLFSWFKKEITANSQIEVYEGVRSDTTLKDWQIKENLRVQYSSDYIKGTFVVTEVFEQPNRENKLCVIEPLIKSESSEKEIKPITINCNQNVLRSVPYETYDEAPDETSIFNEPLNEEMLAPFVEKTTDQSKEANLYWLPIEEASGYSVTLYKKRNNDAEQQKNKVYFLQRFEIDRNKHWLTLNDLIGKGYIIILEAENRQGQIIAKTRGINLDTKKLEWF